MILSGPDLSVSISENGIQAIAARGRVVTAPPSQDFLAAGGRQGLRASAAFRQKQFPSYPGRLATDGTLITVYADFMLTQKFSLVGNTLKIACSVLAGPGGSMPAPIIIGLPNFAFAAGAMGSLPSWNEDQLSSEPQNTFHQSLWTPLGVHYARDGNFGISFHCPTHFKSRSVFCSFLQAPAGSAAPPVADISFFLMESLSPGQSIDFDICMTIMPPSADYLALTLPYCKDIAAALGPQQYTPNKLPVIEMSAYGQTILAIYGYQAYIDYIKPLLPYVGAVIGWPIQGGGGNISPAGDMILTALAQKIRALASAISPVAIGQSIRPGMILTPTPSGSAIVPLHPKDPAHIAMLSTRFLNMESCGITAFYLDSFGEQLNDWILAAENRSWAGPSRIVMAEFGAVDLLVPYCAAYGQVPPGPWTGNMTNCGAETLAIRRQAYPDSQIYLCSPNGAMPPPSAKVMLESGIMPIVLDGQANNAGTIEMLKAFTGK